MKKILLLLLTVVSFQVMAQQAVSIEDLLFDLPDLKFKKVSNPDDKYPVFECFIRQPLDHKNPEKGSFYHRLELTHRGFGKPTVMATQGYNLNRGRNEVSEILDANYINIEHRYFGESVPEPLDWQYLNLENATADLHHINQIFKQIYKGSWVSTGISKGGQTTIFYRYFYPNDVDVSIPYVAPLNTDFEDKRIYAFLDTVGTDECREKIYAVQKKLLKNKKEVLDKLKWFVKGANYEFEYLGSLEAAFEYAVLEYSFSFWQWGWSCDDLPTGRDLDKYIESFLNVAGLSFYDDKTMSYFAPHYYQATTQMGYYGFETDKFKGLIDKIGKTPNASFTPLIAVDTPRDYELPKKVGKWLDENGNKFVYIYGGIDTWSATRVIPSGKVDVLYYLMAGKHHGNARISNLTDAQKVELADTLKKWLNSDVNMRALKIKK